VHQLVARLNRSERPVDTIHRAGTARVVVLGEATSDCPGLPFPVSALRRGVVVASVDPESDPAHWLHIDRLPLSTLATSASIRKSKLGTRVEESTLGRSPVRLTSPGRMQNPPPGWPHDGRPLLLPFLRLVTPG